MTLACFGAWQRRRDSKRQRAGSYSPRKVLSARGALLRQYKLTSEVIGRGKYSEVRLGVDHETGKHVAIKIVQKSRIDDTLTLTQLQREATVLGGLEHPYVVRLLADFEDAKEILLVTELCHGRELWKELDENSFFSEKQAKAIILPILEGVRYLHGRGVCHRDLKLENVMVSSERVITQNSFGVRHSNVKLIDFGLACESDSTEKQDPGFGVKRMNSSVGTLYYASPQVLATNYDRSCDLWSVGVMFYMLLSGCPPFNGKSNEEIRQKISIAEADLNHSNLRGLSANAKDLLRQLLHPKESKRITAEQAVSHPFFQSVGLGDVDVDVQVLPATNSRQ